MPAQISLKEAVFSIWNKNYERQGFNNNFKPLFVQYIGVPDTEEDYNNILATLFEKISQNPNKAILFDGQIQMKANLDLLSSVKQDLLNMDVFNLSSNDIVMFSDSNANNNFIIALQYVINLACKQENFQNDSIRNNFICTMLLHIFSYIKDMEFEGFETCKCIYYGDINRTEIYFLILLSKMGFDVLYLNPLRNNDFQKIDSDFLSNQIQYKSISPIESFFERAKKGKAISKIDSITLQLERQIENELYNGEIIFKPWQFRKGNTSSILFNGNLIDLEQNINQPAKVRNGFSVSNLKVSVPHFFMVINGISKDISEYKKIVKMCRDSSKAYFTSETLFSFDKWEDFQRSEVVFCQKGDGTFDVKSVQQLSFFPFKNYDEEIQEFFINKINETILDISFYKNTLDSSQKRIDFLELCLNMPEDFFELVNNFDFTGDIPKIIIFLEKKNILPLNFILLLGLFSHIGFDIIIFSPSGMNGINKEINPSQYNDIRFEDMKYDISLSDIIISKEGFFNKIEKLFNFY